MQHNYEKPGSTASSIGDEEGVHYRDDDKKSPHTRTSRAVVFGSLGGAFLILALALGLGLGIGLKHHHDTSSSSNSSAGSSSNSPSASALSSVLAPSSSNFVLQGANAMNLQAPQIRSYEFVLEERIGAPDGFSKHMLVVNGQFPGPTIEVNQGDRIVVNVTNKMPNATAIHWHGLPQTGTPWYDGTNGISQCGIPPGESLVYNFTLGVFVGTTWWHAHYGTQYTDGISGGLVVHATNESVPTTDGEMIVEMADLYHRYSTDLLNFYLSPAGITGAGDIGTSQGNEPVPDSGTINGIGQWGNQSSYSDYTLEQNKSYRLRLVNSGSFSAVRFSVDNHVLTVVEADGTAITPYNVSGLTIEVAQRYSVIVHTNQAAGAYWMRATLSQDSYTYVEPEFNGNQLAILRYGVSLSTMPSPALINNDPGPGTYTVSDLNISSLVPANFQIVPNASVSYLVSISMQKGDNGIWYSFVNTTSWTPLPGGQASLMSGTGNSTFGSSVTDQSQFIIDVPENAPYVDIVVNNYDDGNHPFHLHSMKFWIMGTGPGRYQGQALDSRNPMIRDTVLFNAYTWTVLRFQASNPGVWAFHCHLVWHMAAGLLMQWRVLTEQIGTPPAQMFDQCATMQALSLNASA